MPEACSDQCRLYHFQPGSGQLDEYEQNNNPIIGFIQEIGLDGIINEATDTVYRRYKEYCISNNFQALSKIEFSRQICKRCGLTSGAKYIKEEKQEFSWKKVIYDGRF